MGDLGVNLGTGVRLPGFGLKQGDICTVPTLSNQGVRDM